MLDLFGGVTGHGQIQLCIGDPFKNVFLNHERTLSRKFQEMALTWRLEQVVPKERILELYLNIVEMGLGIHGVDQASQAYFGKRATYLTPIEAVHLAALTPSPRPLSQRFARGGARSR